jgi:hypothetical protein
LNLYEWGFVRGGLPDAPSYDRKEPLGGMQVSPGQRLSHNISNLATQVGLAMEQGAEFYFFGSSGIRVGYFSLNSAALEWR